MRWFKRHQHKWYKAHEFGPLPCVLDPCVVIDDETVTMAAYWTMWMCKTCGALDTAMTLKEVNR